MAPTTSPASRRAEARDSTTTVARAASASSTSRASGSCEPIATTVAWSATSAPSNSGSRAVVAAADHVGGGDELRRRRRRRGRPMSTCSMGRTARIASTCPWACGPRPKTSSRRASGAASARTASAETAGVRRFVSAMPSTRATGRERRGVEDDADALDARLAADGHELDDGMAAGADGITSSSPPPTASALAAGRPPGPGRPAARLERVDGAGRPRRCGDLGRRRGRAGSSQDEAGAERVARVEHEAVLAGAVRHPLDLGEHALVGVRRPRGR